MEISFKLYVVYCIAYLDIINSLNHILFAPAYHFKILDSENRDTLSGQVPLELSIDILGGHIHTKHTEILQKGTVCFRRLF